MENAKMVQYSCIVSSSVLNFEFKIFLQNLLIVILELSENSDVKFLTNFVKEFCFIILPNNKSKEEKTKNFY